MDGVAFGNMAPCKPDKVNDPVVKKPNKFVWYQDAVNLFQLKIDGPFNFENGCHIPKAAWKALEAVAEEQRIYVGGLNRKATLGKPDKEDKDKKGSKVTWPSCETCLPTATTEKRKPKFWMCAVITCKTFSTPLIFSSVARSRQLVYLVLFISLL
jgi:hypothetical protein